MRGKQPELRRAQVDKDRLQSKLWVKNSRAISAAVFYRPFKRIAQDFHL